MNITDVDAALEAAQNARTKKEVQEAVDPFGIDLDLRSTLPELKKAVTSALSDVRADLVGDEPEDEPSLPDLGEEPAAQEKPKGPRILVHKENGRRFVWTPALAKLSHLAEEV